MAITPMIQILDLVSPNLEHLEIDASHRSPSDYDEWYDTVDAKFITADLHFPALTHVRLTNNALRYIESVATICNAAPNLILLDALLVACVFSPIEDEPDPPLQEVIGDTQLRYLRLHHSNGWTDIHAEEVYVNEPIKSLFQHSPALIQCSLDSISSSFASKELLTILADMKNLQVLGWGSDVEELNVDLTDVRSPGSDVQGLDMELTHIDPTEVNAFSALRCLILHTEDSMHVSESVCIRIIWNSDGSTKLMYDSSHTLPN